MSYTIRVVLKTINIYNINNDISLNYAQWSLSCRRESAVIRSAHKKKGKCETRDYPNRGTARHPILSVGGGKRGRMDA